MPEERHDMLTPKTLEFEWVVQETALIEKARKREVHRVDSEVYAGWRLIATTTPDDTSVNVFVQPIDIKSETRVAVEFQAFPEHDRTVCFEKYILRATFEPKTLGSGTSLLREGTLRRIGTRKIVITCKITRGDKPPAPIVYRSGSEFFNRFDFSDVALVAAKAQPPIFLQSFMLRKSPHFKAILDSEFSESNSTTRLPPPRAVSPDDRFVGDVDEFAAFNMHRQSGEDAQPQQDIGAAENDHAPSQPAKRPRLTSPLDSVKKEEEQAPLRDFRLVKVSDCSYATLGAYLAYLYTSALDFLPSAALFRTEEKEPGTSTEADISRWAHGKAKWYNYPALPHAMYRLADCYMEPTIKARARSSILGNITVETMRSLRTLFTAELRYPEFQADVLDFVLANISDVIATPGWKRAVALIDEGRIPGGGSILHKIVSGSNKPPA